MKRLRISASPLTGKNARIPPHAQALLDGEPEGEGVDAHGIQFLLHRARRARLSSMQVKLDLEGEAFTVHADPVMMNALLSI